jgi:hypothetical protein
LAALTALVFGLAALGLLTVQATVDGLACIGTAARQTPGEPA